MGMLEDDIEANFRSEPRKVHLHHDQHGATYGGFGRQKPRPFANTLCKMNSDVPTSHITTDVTKVTCKICRKDHRFKVAANATWRGTTNMAADEPKLPAPLPRRHRVNWRGKLILQVLESGKVWYDPSFGNGGGEWVPYETWRDATLADLDIGVA